MFPYKSDAASDRLVMSSSGGGGGHAPSAHAAAGAPAEFMSHAPADRLARLMQRHALGADAVAQQLQWPPEQLRAYLANRRPAALTLDVRTVIMLYQLYWLLAAGN